MLCSYSVASSRPGQTSEANFCHQCFLAPPQELQYVPLPHCPSHVCLSSLGCEVACFGQEYWLHSVADFTLLSCRKRFRTVLSFLFLGFSICSSSDCKGNRCQYHCGVGWGVTQLKECLLHIYEAMGSVPGHCVNWAVGGEQNWVRRGKPRGWRGRHSPSDKQPSPGRRESSQRPTAQ